MSKHKRELERPKRGSSPGQGQEWGGRREEEFAAGHTACFFFLSPSLSLSQLRRLIQHAFNQGRWKSAEKLQTPSIPQVSPFSHPPHCQEIKEDTNDYVTPAHRRHPANQEGVDVATCFVPLLPNCQWNFGFPMRFIPKFLNGPRVL